MRIILLTIILAFRLVAQEPEDEVPAVLADGTEEEASIREMMDRLEELRREPVDISRPAYGELLRIPFLSPLTAESIMLLADTVELTDIAMVRSASLMTPELFERIAPYITVSSPPPASALFIPQHAELRTRLERRVQSTKGFRDRDYEGDPYATYQRIELSGEYFRAAFLREKDAGETDDAGFSAAYLSAEHLAGLDRIVAGNFSVSSAQGLIFARSMTAAKGSDAAGQTMQRNNGIRPSVSADEFRYFRGFALRTSVLPFSLSLFSSFRTLSASTDSSGTVTSFYTSGLFRNASEHAREGGVSERTFGAAAEYQPVPSAVISLNAVRVEYGRRIRTTAFAVPEARPVQAASVGWHVPFMGTQFYGETASDDKRHSSFVAGIIVPVRKIFTVTFHHRSLPYGFTSPFARPFAERIVGSGEYGNYIGFEAAADGFRLSAYVDHARFPATAEEFAASRLDHAAFAEIPVAKGHTLQLQYRSAADVTHTRLSSDRVRAGFSSLVGSGVSLYHRVERVHVSDAAAGKEESGMLAFSELHWHPRNERVVFRSRFVWFDAPSFASRLYQYEPDVPGNISNPQLYGNGFRWFALIRIRVTDGCWFSAKYAELTKLHVGSLGSGEDSIEGALDSRAALQLDFRL